MINSQTIDIIGRSRRCDCSLWTIGFERTTTFNNHLLKVHLSVFRHLRKQLQGTLWFSGLRSGGVVVRTKTKGTSLSVRGRRMLFPRPLAELSSSTNICSKPRHVRTLSSSKPSSRLIDSRSGLQDPGLFLWLEVGVANCWSRSGDLSSVGVRH